MFYFFLILLAIGLAINVIGTYIELIPVLPNAYTYLMVMAGLLIVELIIHIIFKNREFKLSAAQQREFDEAESSDRAKSDQEFQQLGANIRAGTGRIRELKDEITSLKRTLNSLDVLDPKDLNLSTVNWLIDTIKSYRANSLTEALRLYDDYREREILIRRARLEEDRRRQEETDRIWREFERDMQAMSHQREMKRIEERKLEELKRIREDLES